MAAGEVNSLLFVKDQVAGRKFLIDTGAQVSVLPATKNDMSLGKSGQGNPTVRVTIQSKFYIGHITVKGCSSTPYCNSTPWTLL